VAAATIGLSGIGIRFVIAFLLVALTWNPTRFNFVEWAMVQWSAMAPLVAFAGLVLLMGWIFFLRTTARALGVLGIVLCTALAAVVLWILFYYGLISTESSQLLGWIVLMLFAAILAAGMSWAHLRNRWSGQATVDDVDQR
jgi:putative flippase GtrA